MTLLEFYDSIYRLHHHMASPWGTVETYHNQIRALQEYYDHQRYEQDLPQKPLLIADLSDDLLAGAMAWKLRQGWSVPTANKLLRTIKCVWRFAKRRGKIATLPDLDRLTENKIEPEAWTKEELERLLVAAAHCPGMIGDVPSSLWWPSLILMACSTGVRISAVMQIKTAQLNLTTGEVFVSARTQKHKADQRFELKPEVCDVLRALRPGRLVGLFDDWPHDRTAAARKRGSWHTLHKHFSGILRSAGLRDSSKDKFHKLRKTFATWIAAEAGEIVAQAMLGHSHINVTRRYLDKRQLKGPSARDLLPAIPLPESMRSHLLPPESAA